MTQYMSFCSGCKFLVDVKCIKICIKKEHYQLKLLNKKLKMSVK